MNYLIKRTDNVKTMDTTILCTGQQGAVHTGELCEEVTLFFTLYVISVKVLFL